MVKVWLLGFASWPWQSLRIRSSFQTSATSCCWRQFLFIYFCQVINVSVRPPRWGFEAGNSCHEIHQKTALTAGCRASPDPHKLHIWTLDAGYRHHSQKQDRKVREGAHRWGGGMEGRRYKSVLVMPYCIKERRSGPVTLHYLSPTAPPALHTLSALCLTYNQRGKGQGTRLGLNLISTSSTRPSSPPQIWEYERRLASVQMGNVPIHQLLLLFLQAAGETGTGWIGNFQLSEADAHTLLLSTLFFSLLFCHLLSTTLVGPCYRA